MNITRRGPHRSDSAPDSQEAKVAVSPYTVKTSATPEAETSRLVRNAERKPDYTPQAHISSSTAGNPQASGG